VSATRPAQPRRKQHAPASASAARRTNQRRAERSPRSGSRAQARAGGRAQAARTEARDPLPTRLVARLRARWLARRSARAAGRSVELRAQQPASLAADAPQPPREWPRRLAIAAVKLGSVVAVAWALLVGGREVYEYATTSPRFEVQHFIYEPTSHVDDEALRELLAIAPGTNILACDLPELSERIAAHPWVAQATITRNLPDTLEIRVVEHEPEAIILAERFYLVDGDGKPFKPVERGERGELPVITGIDREQLREDREAATREIADALAVIRLYQSKQRPRLGEIHLDDDRSITLYTAETGTQLRLGRSGYAARLERWDALRAALGDRADRLAVVHLDHESKPDRRDRVVARFANDRDEAVLLAQAATEAAGEQDSGDQFNPEADAVATSPARPPAPNAGRRNRIPRYE
jgi:cell division protein FtsQ